MKKSPQQLALNSLLQKQKSEFGGSYLKNSNPKVARPIATKRPMHVVLRSDFAKGKNSMLGEARAIEKILVEQGRKLGVKVDDLSNVGNHLHLVVRPLSPRAFKRFLRAVCGLIARLMLKAERGKASRHDFFTGRPFSRIVDWGRSYATLKKYLHLNRLESIGIDKATGNRIIMIAAAHGIGLNQWSNSSPNSS